MRLNEAFDSLPRTRFGRATREVPAFRTCGVTGFYVAVVATLGCGLIAGLSLLVVAAVCAVCGLSFFVYAHVRRRIGGAENLILLEHVWVAEACVAGVLWALGEPVLAYLDAVAVGLSFFLAGGRIGCLLVGCCHGRPSSLGIRYGEEAALDGFPRHLVGVRLLPVPALEAAALLVIGASGLAALPSAPDGAVFTWFLVAYSVVRFGLEGLRGDERPHVLGLSVNRWMCLAEFSFALALWTHEQGGFGAREIAIAASLAVLLAAALSVRALTDRRRVLLSDTHVDEVRRIVESSLRHASSDPRAEITTAGIVVAATPASDGMPVRHVSLSHADRASTPRLLCDLVAKAFPGVVAEGASLSEAGVLHVLVADVDGTVGDARRMALILFGEVVRRRQAEPPQAAPVRPPPLETARAAYFGG
jgi:prolipoprotein diacylglyceryl transferase